MFTAEDAMSALLFAESEPDSYFAETIEAVVNELMLDVDELARYYDCPKSAGLLQRITSAQWTLPQLGSFGLLHKDRS